MGHRNFLIGAAAAAAAVSSPITAAPVPAPSSANSDGRALVLVPLKITKIDDLDFGTMISPSADGTVALNATTSKRTYTGGVVGVPSDPGHRAYFGGAGSPNQQVILALVPPTELTDSNGDTIGVLALTLDNGGNPVRTIDPTTRAFFVGVGGVLEIAANQPDGDYSATFQLLANYQ